MMRRLERMAAHIGLLVVELGNRHDLQKQARICKIPGKEVPKSR